MPDLESRVHKLEAQLGVLQDVSIDLIVLLAYGTGKAQLISDSLTGLAQKNKPELNTNDQRAAALTDLLSRLSLRVPAAPKASTYAVGPWKR